MHAGQIVAALPGRQAPARPPPLAADRGPLPRRRRHAARLARARDDVRAVPASSRGPRRPSSFCENRRRDGGPRRHLARRARELRRRRRPRGRRASTASSGARCTGTRRAGRRARTAGSGSSCTSRSTGAPAPARSAPSVQAHVADYLAPDGRRSPRHRRRRRRRGPPPVAQRVVGPDRRDARARAGRLPDLRLVAVARRPDGVDKERWIEKAEEDWGAWGALYRDDDGRAARLDPVRAGAALPARRRAAGRPAVRRRRARHLRLPRRRARRRGSSSRSSSPRSARRATRARRRSRRSPTAIRRASRRYERFLVHRTVFPRDFLADFGFQPVRAQGRVELARLELGGLATRRGGQAREGAARRQGGVRARAGAAAAVGARRRTRCCASRSSAIWIAFSAAPLRRLSPTTKSASPFSIVGSLADPADEHVVAARGAAAGSGTARAGSRARRRGSRSPARPRAAPRSRPRSPRRGRRAPARARTSRSPAAPGSSRILRVSSRSFASSSNSSPSKSQSMRRSFSLRRLAAQPLHRLCARAGDRLVGGDAHAREPGRVVQRLQRAGERDRAAVRVGDDALVLGRPDAVHLGHDERDAAARAGRRTTCRRRPRRRGRRAGRARGSPRCRPRRGRGRGRRRRAPRASPPRRACPPSVRARPSAPTRTARTSP